MDNAKPDTAIVEKAATHVCGTIKPLAWHDCTDGSSHDDDCQYEIMKDGGFMRLCRAVTGGGGYLMHTTDIESAKAAAQADYEARILAQIDPDPEAQPVAWLMECPGYDVSTVTNKREQALLTKKITGWTITGLYAHPAPAARAEVSVAETDVAELIERALAIAAGQDEYAEKVFNHLSTAGIIRELVDALRALTEAGQ